MTIAIYIKFSGYACQFGFPLLKLSVENTTAKIAAGVLAAFGCFGHNVEKRNLRNTSVAFRNKNAVIEKT